MNILMITLGSRGDVQPCIALGKGLKADGHRVTLCTCSSFEDLITRHGLEYGFINNEFIEWMNSIQGRHIMENASGLAALIRTAFKLYKRMQSMMDRLLRDMWKVAEQLRPDLLILASKGINAKPIADKLRIPVVMAMPFPHMVPTGEFPSVIFPKLPLGRLYNRASYQLFLQLAPLFNRSLQRFSRDVLKVPRGSESSGFLTQFDGRPVPQLHGFSNHVVPRPADWPEWAYVTGYWFLEDSKGWDPPSDLLEFLNQGEPPVYFGFGSMAGQSPDKLTDIVVTSLKKLNLRGIIATGWGGLSMTDKLPSNSMILKEAPHDWLFSKVSAVVHHGGAGTTAAGLREGKPTFICPFIVDQPFWGNRVHALGLGPEPVPMKKLSVEKLSAALEELVSNRDIKLKSQAMGEKIRKENGVETAVKHIDQIFGRKA